VDIISVSRWSSGGIAQGKLFHGGEGKLLRQDAGHLPVLRHALTPGFRTARKMGHPSNVSRFVQITGFVFFILLPAEEVWRVNKPDGSFLDLLASRATGMHSRLCWQS
jgi:hypothetical protein